MSARTRIRRLPLPLRAVIEFIRPLGEHRRTRRRHTTQGAG